MEGGNILTYSATQTTRSGVQLTDRHLRSKDPQSRGSQIRCLLCRFPRRELMRFERFP
jgi:hypothetical protein